MTNVALPLTPQAVAELQAELERRRRLRAPELAPHLSLVDLPGHKLNVLTQSIRHIFLKGGRGSAKCLAIGTRIIMADGTLRAIENVMVNDLVMGPDSRPRKVLSTTHGIGQLYRINQTSGIEYVVNDSHILSLKKSASSARDKGRLMPSGNFKRSRGRYPDEPNIKNISVTDALQKSKRWMENFRGYKCGLIQFEEQPVTIDPYLLGVWLGDGTGREMRITSADQEIVNWLSDHADSLGLRFSLNGKAEEKAKDIGIGRSIGSKTNRLWQEFIKYDLPNNKHIPRIYLANSEQCRMDLLAGLIDTDGHLSGNCYLIAQVNERLARDIKYLADGLGFRTSINRRKTVCTNNGVCGFAWYVSISGNAWRIPCKIKRKRLSVEDVNPNKDFMLSYISIEDAGIGEYAGISLDGDHLFLLEDGTVTHNSWSVAETLIKLARTSPLRFLCTREYQNSIADSVHKLLSDTITRLGIDSWFTITLTSIKSKAGAEFLFKGLHNNSKEIKSTEGVDICWVEEGQSISKESLEFLLPTIRESGSRLIFTYNPENDDDPIHKMAMNPPEDSVTVHVNFDENPYFSKELEQLRQWYLKRIDDADTDAEREEAQSDYDHVWLGETKKISNELVLSGKCVVQDFPDYLWKKADRLLFGADFGFAQDPSTLIRSFILDACLYIEYEAYGTKVELNEMDQFYRSVPGSEAWPIKADNSRPETISHMRGFGFNCQAADKWPGSVEDGITHLRGFKKIIIHTRCKHTTQEAKQYKYKKDRQTGDILPIIIDKHNHCIAEGQLVQTARGLIPIEKVQRGDQVLTRAGMRRVQSAWQASPDRELWEVRAGDHTLLATPNHQVFTVNRGFARIDALRYDDELLIHGDESESVRYVKSHSSAINTPATKLVPARVQCVRDTGKRSAVYDLAVDGQHEFVVSGILVHNCWDAVRYSLDGYIQRRGDLGIWARLGQPS